MQTPFQLIQEQQQATQNYLQDNINERRDCDNDDGANVYFIDLGSGDQKASDRYSFNDGILVVNPYPENQGVYLIYGEIFKKWRDNNGVCGPIGVPTAERKWANIPDNTKVVEARKQDFRKGDYANNRIYHYNWEENCGAFDGECKKGKETYFVVNEVADDYKIAGGSTGYNKFPTGDTKGNSSKTIDYCRQDFEHDRDIDLCSMMEAQLDNFWNYTDYTDDQSGTTPDTWISEEDITNDQYEVGGVEFDLFDTAAIFLETFVSVYEDLEWIMEPAREDCPLLDFSCSNTANIAETVARLSEYLFHWLLGLDSGLAEGAKNLISEVFEAVLHPIETVVQIVDLIKAIYNDPWFIAKAYFSDMADKMEGMAGMDRFDRAHTSGEILGEQVFDILTLFVGGEGLISGLGKTLEKLGESSKVASKITDFTKVVGQKFSIGKTKVQMEIAKLADNVFGFFGDDMLKAARNLPDEDFAKLVDDLADAAQKAKLIRYRYQIKLNEGLGLSKTTTTKLIDNLGESKLDDFIELTGKLDDVQTNSLRNLLNSVDNPNVVADMMNALGETKTREILDDHWRFLQSGGDVGVVKNNEAVKYIEGANDLVAKNPGLKLSGVGDNTVISGNGINGIKAKDILPTFSDDIILDNLNNHIGETMYRVSVKGTNGGTNTYWTFTKPRNLIGVEKDLALKRTEWYSGVSPEDGFSVYEYTIKAGEDLPFLLGKAASQEPWFQYPGGTEQLYFEPDKLVEKIKGQIIENPISYD